MEKPKSKRRACVIKGCYRYAIDGYFVCTEHWVHEAAVRKLPKRTKKPKVLTGLAAQLAIMRAICRAIERDK